MTPCPLASRPQDCLALYRLRTSKLVHSWETIPCTTCRYLRVNGELAPRPDDDVLPGIAAMRERGFPCPVCGRPRRYQKDISPDKPCTECRRKTEAYKVAARERFKKRYREKVREKGPKGKFLEYRRTG